MLLSYIQHVSKTCGITYRVDHMVKNKPKSPCKHGSHPYRHRRLWLFLLY